MWVGMLERNWMEMDECINEMYSPRGIFINQSKYALESLKKYGYESCDPMDTPMVEKSKLDEDKEGKMSIHHTIVARPTEKHLNAVKRIFRSDHAVAKKHAVVHQHCTTFKIRIASGRCIGGSCHRLKIENAILQSLRVQISHPRKHPSSVIVLKLTPTTRHSKNCWKLPEVKMQNSKASAICFHKRSDESPFQDELQKHIIGS
ncbi:hypothetical protein Tco_1515226 [Tanacetum coccineum]